MFLFSSLYKSTHINKTKKKNQNQYLGKSILKVCKRKNDNSKKKQL